MQSCVCSFFYSFINMGSNTGKKTNETCHLRDKRYCPERKTVCKESLFICFFLRPIQFCTVSIVCQAMGVSLYCFRDWLVARIFLFCLYISLSVCQVLNLIPQQTLLSLFFAVPALNIAVGLLGLFRQY